MSVRAIITGATGMVGEGVLLECLEDSNVEQVLVINRRPGGRTHPKLREIIHADFFDLTAIAGQLTGYNACFFCLGVSSVGISAEEYKRLTYDLTINAGTLLAELNPGMTFCYVTGAGADSSEEGKVAWARVKGATENVLLRLFVNGYMFRPGFMKETPGQRNVKSYYRWIAWTYPFGRKLFPRFFCTLQEVARAMVRCVSHPPRKHILEVRDIVELAGAK